MKFITMLEQLLAEYYSLIQTYNTTINRLNAISQSIKTYGGDVPDASQLPGSDIAGIIANVRESLYPEKGTWSEKIVYILKRLKKASASEIFEHMRKVEPLLFNKNNSQNVSNYSNAVASTCSRMAKDGELDVDQTKSPYKYSLKGE